MPYTYSTQTKEGRKKFCMTSKKTGKTYCYDSPAARERGAKTHEMFAHMPTKKKETADEWLKKKSKWKKSVDNRIRTFGDIDYEKKKIRINPKKGDVVDTIAHENFHRLYPNKTEKQIKTLAKEKIRTTSLRQKIEMLKEYL